MGRWASAILLAVFTSQLSVRAQVSTTGPRFEVASIRPILFEQFHPSHPQGTSGFIVSDHRVDVDGLTMNFLVSQAFDVNPALIVGADIYSDQRYIVHALMPESATKDQVPEMLRSLLKERFNLVAHRETRDIKGYALVTGKNGPSLNKPREIDRSVCSPWVADPLTPGAETCRKFDSTEHTSVMASTGGWTGPVLHRTNSDGSRNEYFGITMPDLAHSLMFALTQHPGPDSYVPVIDRTGISGKWGIVVETWFDDSTDRAVANLNAWSSSLEKFGLKLEKTMVPVETLVIDHVDSNPTDN